MSTPNSAQSYPPALKLVATSPIANVVVPSVSISPFCVHVPLIVPFPVPCRYLSIISLGSVMCALLYPLLLSRFGGVGVNVIMAFMITILVVVMHRGNIKRILDKTESKISFSKKNIKDAEEKGNADNGNENKKK